MTRNTGTTWAGLCLVFLLGNSAFSFAESVDFGAEVWPIIERRCIECHGPEEQEEGLRFDDWEWLGDEELLGGGDVYRQAKWHVLGSFIKGPFSVVSGG